MPAGRCSNQITAPEATRSACHRRRLLILPMVVAGLLAGLYAVVRPTTWQATQTLVIRVNGAARVQGLGEPSTLDQLTLAAETIDEVADSREALAAAWSLAATQGGQAGDPSETDIVDLRQAIRWSAPREIDAGDAEIVSLRLKDRHRERALALVTALAEEIATRSQQRIQDKAQSSIEELTNDESLAAERLQAATRQLVELEQQAGTHVNTLQGEQHRTTVAESSPQQTVVSLDSRIRVLEQTNRDNQAQLACLQNALKNPTELATTSRDLLDTQPALRRLKEELDDAQMKGALLRGTMSEQHPQVESAVANEQAIRQQLETELAGSIKILQDEIAQSTDQIASLQMELQNVRDQAEQLSEVGSDHASLAAEVRVRTAALNAAQRRLAEARTREAKARNTCTIQVLDPQHPTIKTIGLSRLGIVFRGLLLGGLIGSGLLFWTRPKKLPKPEPEPMAVSEPVVPAAPTKSVAPESFLTQDQQLLRESLRKALSSRF